MAIVKLSDGSQRILNNEQATALWQVLNGEVEPTKEQEAFAARVDKIYLNRHKAPKSYIDAHFDIIRQMPPLT